MEDEFGDFEGEKFAASDVLTCPNCKAKDGLELQDIDEETGVGSFYCQSCGTFFVGGMVGEGSDEKIPIDPKIKKLSQKSARKKGLKKFCYCFMCGEAFATTDELFQHQDDKGHVLPVDEK